ncbi:MAG: RNA-binding protein [Planctomycetaceae bacterium]
MANKTLFNSTRGRLAPKADTTNEAGGLAYSLDAKHALAQLAATGCLNQTFYASPTDQLDQVLNLCENLEPEFIARVALYARSKGHMKDVPALLCAVLSVKSPGLLAEVFDRVIDTPRMLRNFGQIMRSGVVGRKSLGSLPKRLVLQWLESRTDKQLFFGSIGNDPSLADIVKMVHPKPTTKSRAALYGYLIGRDYVEADLPEIVLQYIKFKRNTNIGKVPVPDVPFQLLTALPLYNKDWKQIARNAPWQMTRMNLNTFMRHDVLKDQEMVSLIANRLRNPRLIEKARVFPYQLLAAYQNVGSQVPNEIQEALQDAMEISINNVPRIDGKVYVFVDVSGSMHSPVTGYRQGSSSKVRCIDVAALVGAAIKRKNRDAEIIPFESKAITNFKLNPRDSVMTNAQKLTALPAGGTNCSAPLEHLNRQKANGDMIIYVSDNESWLDSPHYGRFGGQKATKTMTEWSKFKSRNPNAKMMCIDIQPYTTTQAKEREDIVNVGGFSDQVFGLIAAVAEGGAGGHWVDVIEKMTI